MDTDDLSTETYKGVLLEAEKFNHDLTLRFALIAGDCENETKYLNRAKKLIIILQEANKSDLSDIFFGSPPKKENLYLALKKISTNISAIEKIPEDKRHYEF
jgi:hypothetical protein